MIYSKIIHNKNFQVIDFVRNFGLVQHSIELKHLYATIGEKFEFKYICCKSASNQIIGVLPFIHYHSYLGDVIHSMPFVGYGGASFLNNDLRILKSMVDELYDFAKQSNVLLVTICTPPFIEGNIYKNIMEPDFIYENFYQYIDLTIDPFSVMTSKNRNNLKRNLKRAEDNGIYLNENYDKSILEFWYETIYIPRMTETNCTIYPFPVFNELRSNFGSNRVIIQYAFQNNKIIGAGFFLKQMQSLDNFMRVIGTEYMDTKAGVLLDYWSIQYARENELLYYNWQSCDKIGSPIFKYKKSWGSDLGYHYYLTKIINPINQLKKVPLNEIKKEYKGIYILPYNEFEIVR
ncbi:hypothetical protein KDN24_14775 [Bacillus sp. Bva_UNVM-123]|uniref:hypothetical protein n=1 Tax=Bacillus sp. Bva_UNVM-123 TaxID=2829798 RepID=UPI00391F924E